MLIGACAPILRPIHVSRYPISDQPESGLTAASRGTGAPEERNGGDRCPEEGDSGRVFHDGYQCTWACDTPSMVYRPDVQASSLGWSTATIHRFRNPSTGPVCDDGIIDLGLISTMSKAALRPISR